MAYVWQLQISGNGYKVSNGLEGYIPIINNGDKVAAVDAGDTFTLTLNGDNNTFAVKGTSFDTLTEGEVYISNGKVFLR